MPSSYTAGIRMFISKLCVTRIACVICRRNTEGKVADADDDEEITSESEGEAEKTPDESESDDCQRMKRKLKLTEFPDLLAKRHKAYKKYR